MYDVLKYVHDNIRLPLLAGDVASKFGYSKWYFCECFKRFTGRTFVEYVRHYRIQLAAVSLLSGQKVLDVALSYGYDGSSGFNKAFLKEYGCSPTEYRKQVQECQFYYEKRRIAMLPLTDRCVSLREEAMHSKTFEKQYCYQRNVYYALGAAQSRAAGEAAPLQVAAGVCHTLDRFMPVILPGERIVGFNFGEAEKCRPENTPAGRIQLSENGISPEDAEAFFALEKAPKPESPHSRIQLTRQELEAQQEWAAIGRCIDSNHTVLGYEKVLQKGFSGLRKEAEAALTKEPENPNYLAMARLCRSAETMGMKYAEKARALLESGHPDYNREDLEEIISTCSQVPKYPATNFQEALQSLWFAHIINTWEDYINANSLGRLDQILYPYYSADITRGTLTKEQAFELICCLWIKLYRDYDVQQSCVGGTDADGRSQVNALSYLMLDATEQLDFIRCLSVRYSNATEKAFLRRALEVVGHVQKGIPFFFNDDIMIPALKAKGIPHEDACGYTQIGCVETVIPGKSNPHAVTGETNLLKAVEYTLCNGSSMRYPEMQPGIATGSLQELKTYDRFYEAVLKQIEHILDLTCSMICKHRAVSADHSPKPYKSLLTEGCLESGRDFNNAGAIYDYYQVMLGGIPNLADSLAVIRKFVYDEKKYTLEELKAQLQANFPSEAIRQQFINKAPKYGNDLESVDSIAAEIMERACVMLDTFSEKYGISFHAQPFTFLWMIDHGQHSAASPDGRRQGEPIAYSCSSMQGRDFSGLTALLNSIARLPAHLAPGTTSAIVEVDPKLFCDRNIDQLTDILIAASEEGLCNVQFNVVDADTLMDAQKHPEHYNNLAVRVSGFSQKFNLLSPELQNHIIGRTKHTCL